MMSLDELATALRKMPTDAVLSPGLGAVKDMSWQGRHIAGVSFESADPQKVAEMILVVDAAYASQVDTPHWGLRPVAAHDEVYVESRHGIEPITMLWLDSATIPIDVVFDGPSGPVAGRFVETEDGRECGVGVGEWIERGNGLHALRIPVAMSAVKRTSIPRI